VPQWHRRLWFVAVSKDTVDHALCRMRKRRTDSTSAGACSHSQSANRYRRRIRQIGSRPQLGRPTAPAGRAGASQNRKQLRRYRVPPRRPRGGGSSAANERTKKSVSINAAARRGAANRSAVNQGTGDRACAETSTRTTAGASGEAALGRCWPTHTKWVKQGPTLDKIGVHGVTSKV